MPSAWAQDESSSFSFPDTPTPAASESSSSRSAARSKSSVQPGIDGNLGIIGLPAYGRDTSIVPLELFPYLETENQILFGDLRGYWGFNGRVGGNIGLGYRFIDPTDTALFGVSGWYDADNLTGKFYQQLAVGWEARLTKAGVYGNVYMPVGNTDRTLSQSITNVRFQDNQVLFDVNQQLGEAMPGMDLYLNGYLPGDFSEEHQIQAAAGWYHFNGTRVSDVNGFRAYVSANIAPAVQTQVAVMHDGTFGTNVTLGLQWRFGTQPPPTADLQGQLRRFVDRNYNVIVARRGRVDAGLAAINPLSGAEYNVQHVGGASLTQQGTASSPFSTVAQAQAAGADVIFVHSGATVNENIVLTNGQKLLGEGVAHTLVDRNYGTITLPGDTTGASTPVIANVAGDAVTLADNTTFSGFTIQNPGGHGIVANLADDFVVSHVTVKNSGDDAVYVSSAQGGKVSNVTIEGSNANGITIVGINDRLDLNNIYIKDVSGSGVSVNGGRGVVAFAEDLVIANSGISAFAVSNLQTLTTTDTKGTTTTADDVVTKTVGKVMADKLVISGGTTGGKGIELTNNQGEVQFGDVDVTTAGATALFVRNTDSVLVTNGHLTSTNAPVADVETADLNVTLTGINANGGSQGMRFVDATGTFFTYGDGTDGSGGLVQNTTTAVFMQNGPTVGFRGVDFTHNNVVADVNGAAGLYILQSAITQTSSSIVNARNLAVLQLTNSLCENNTLSSGSGILFQADTVGTYVASVTSNTIKLSPGTFLKAGTLAGGETSKLTLAFDRNAVTLSGTGSMATALNWTGVVNAEMVGNAISGTDANQTAFQLFTGASTDLSQFAITQNGMIFSGTNAVGVDLNSQGPNSTAVASNQIRFNGTNGTGVRATLAKTSGIAISGNAIADYAGGATGILFTAVENGSQLAISGNGIDLSHAAILIDRGIVLSAITANDGSTNPFVTFSSSASNTISGASTELYVPSTGVQGQLIINGATVQ